MSKGTLVLRKSDTISDIVGCIHRLLDSTEVVEGGKLCIAILDSKGELLEFASSGTVPLRTYAPDGCCPTVAAYWQFMDRADEKLSQTPLVSEALGG